MTDLPSGRAAHYISIYSSLFHLSHTHGLTLVFRTNPDTLVSTKLKALHQLSQYQQPLSQSTCTDPCVPSAVADLIPVTAFII
jgi:hypothetical protein